MRTGRLLLVEDDSRLNTALARSLRHHYRVDQVATLAGAYNHLAESRAPYDVIILDRVLPDGDGLELLSFIRRETPETKVCVTSHKDTLAEKLRGLQSGADAYLPKPVHPHEVAAHVEALLRRGIWRSGDEIVFNGLKLNEADRFLCRDQQTIHLSQREVQLLHLFFSSYGHASHEKIQSFYWRLGIEPTSTVIHVSIRRLRRKLTFLNVRLSAIYGLGYAITV